VFWALLILLGAVGVAAFVFVSGVSLRRALRNALSPTVRVPAKFVRKPSRDWEVDAPLSVAGSEEGAVIREMDMRLRRDPGVTIASWADCFATFEISGEEKEFVVSAECYARLNHGDRGLLVYKGDSVREFVVGLAE